MKHIFLLLCIIGLAGTPLKAQNSGQPENLQYLDFAEGSFERVKQLASIASENKLAVVVWGGESAFQQQVYNAALDIIDSNIDLAFIRGPSIRSESREVVVSIYAASSMRYTEVWDVGNAADIRRIVGSAGIYLHNYHFRGLTESDVSYTDDRFRIDGGVYTQNQVDQALDIAEQRILDRADR